MISCSMRSRSSFETMDTFSKRAGSGMSRHAIPHRAGQRLRNGMRPASQEGTQGRCRSVLVRAAGPHWTATKVSSNKRSGETTRTPFCQPSAGTSIILLPVTEAPS